MRALFTFPTGNYNFTRAQTDAAISRALAAGLSAIAWQGAVGQAEYYDTTLMPRSSIVTADYDPLDYALTQAHAAGLELWFWWPAAYAPAWAAWRTMYPDADWQLGYISGGTYRWLNFSNSDTRTWAASVIDELLTNYPTVDGVIMDYMRYPSPSSGFDPSDYIALSASQITATVHAIGDVVHTHSKELACSVYAGWDGDTNCLQNWRSDWMTDGVCDIYMPMCFIPPGATGVTQMTHFISDWDASVTPAAIEPLLFFDYNSGIVKTAAELTAEVVQSGLLTTAWRTCHFFAIRTSPPH